MLFYNCSFILCYSSANSSWGRRDWKSTESPIETIFSGKIALLIVHVATAVSICLCSHYNSTDPVLKRILLENIKNMVVMLLLNQVSHLSLSLSLPSSYFSVEAHKDQFSKLIKEVQTKPKKSMPMPVVKEEPVDFDFEVAGAAEPEKKEKTEVSIKVTWCLALLPLCWFLITSCYCLLGWKRWILTTPRISHYTSNSFQVHVIGVCSHVYILGQVYRQAGSHQCVHECIPYITNNFPHEFYH